MSRLGDFITGRNRSGQNDEKYLYDTEDKYYDDGYPAEPEENGYGYGTYLVNVDENTEYIDDAIVYDYYDIIPRVKSMYRRQETIANRSGKGFAAATIMSSIISTVLSGLGSMVTILSVINSLLPGLLPAETVKALSAQRGFTGFISDIAVYLLVVAILSAIISFVMKNIACRYIKRHYLFIFVILSILSILAAVAGIAAKIIAGSF